MNKRGEEYLQALREERHARREAEQAGLATVTRWYAVAQELGGYGAVPPEDLALSLLCHYCGCLVSVVLADRHRERCAS